MKDQLSSEANQADAGFLPGGETDGFDPTQAVSLDVLVNLLEQATIRRDLRQEKQASGRA